ncbi:FecR domain-containing protein [Achromobacter sp. Root565]|uniref:FecR domain-containing protein n=1 Tax=Achromobacter sp. Root565 TaxID=1736564 RepID=UPI0006F2064E|nr:FecR domain-containing protein [Achromobacter sp. Root565]KRA00605.1 iron dicitrate transport regulator FecR [Achromobacter sp. Root565]
MNAAIDPAILHEAAGWLVRLQSETLSAADRAALARWRARSADHEAAWQRAEAMLRGFGQVPPRIGRQALRQADRTGRRQAVRALAGLLVLGPAAWLGVRELPWREWRADLRTATGEQRRVELADGTQLVLNTASAVDVDYTPTQRVLWLRAGEILLTTGRDPAPAPRPFLVQTTQGVLRALGTRFMVRDEGASVRVAVYEGAVEVRPARADASALVLAAGEQTVFTASGAAARVPADSLAASWADGMLAARNWRLADLVDELGRYRHGVLRCDPAVAELRVSGAFPLNDIEASLRLLQKTLPVRVSRVTPWWTTIAPRAAVTN